MALWLVQNEGSGIFIHSSCSSTYMFVYEDYLLLLPFSYCFVKSVWMILTLWFSPQVINCWDDNMTELVGKRTSSRVPGSGANLLTNYTVSLAYSGDEDKLIFSGRGKIRWLKRHFLPPSSPPQYKSLLCWASKESVTWVFSIYQFWCPASTLPFHIWEITYLEEEPPSHSGSWSVRCFKLPILLLLRRGHMT